MAGSDKATLRRRLRTAREQLPHELVEGWSASIAARLYELDVWRSARAVHCYVGSLAGEVRTDAVIERALIERKRVICPRVRPHGHLDHCEVSSLRQLVESAFGLREPNPERSPLVDPAQADLIILPGLGFSEDGSRLGLGRGYYDRLLAQVGATAVGLAFEMQLASELPRHPHDRPVDLIVTELRVVRCR